MEIEYLRAPLSFAHFSFHEKHSGRTERAVFVYVKKILVFISCGRTKIQQAPAIADACGNYNSRNATYFTIN